MYYICSIKRGGFVYIITNLKNTVLYTGVTSNLYKRTLEHKTCFYPNSFTSKYKCNKLVFFAFYTTIEEAISEEKRIKAGNRNAKIKLINSVNPNWIDLFESL